MLTCKEFLQELNDYLDETASRDIRERLEKHVSECPNCWVIVDTTRRTLKIYKGMEQKEIPEDVQARLLAALDRKMRSQVK